MLLITPTEVNTANNITVTASGLLPGATFSVVDNNTNHPACSFTWTSTGVAPGNYIFYLTYKDDACPISGTQTNAFTISVKPLPHLTTTSGTTTCYDPSATLTAFAPGARSYSWSPDAGLSCMTCDTTVAYGFVNTVYTVTVTDTLGCHSADTASLLVNHNAPGPILHDMSVDATIAYGTSIQLSVQGATIYYWTPNDGTLNNTNINDPIATPHQDTRYTVYGYNFAGCPDSAFVTINVVPAMETIPNAFTPNDDGLNDIFHISNLQFGKLVEMRVYNRWGQMVCKTTDNDKGWDGKYYGEPQDMGIYNYYILVERENGKTMTYKGDVTLIR